MNKPSCKSKMYIFIYIKAKRIEKYRKEKEKKIKTHKRLFSRVLTKDFMKSIQ